ncbi:MAG: hypothetical protein HFJ09_05680 [Lachnospiraceae bacterium]|nr:hypothetical protein [Lachnospiraceae bacterium]
MEERMKEINKKLEHAIETENEKETENLVNLLAKEKGLIEEIPMPKNFAKKIQKEKGRRIMANKSRVLKVAAASLAAVCALGGTTYAATHWNFDKVQFTDAGIMVVDDKNKDVKVEDSVDGSEPVIKSETVGDKTYTTVTSGEGAKDSPETKSAISGLPEIKEKDCKVETLKEQKGTKDTNWSYMVKKLETIPSYSSDDGNNWKQNGWNKNYCTDYTYDTWENFRADKVMPVVFDEKTFEGFALDNSKILYKEEQFKFLEKGKQAGEEKEEVSYKSYEATYLKGKKKMEIKLLESEGYKEIKDDDTAEYVQLICPPSDDGKSENQRHYTTKENVKYALEDVTRDKKKATFAYLSGNGYSISVIFTNMSEQEIHNVLDTVDATELLK